METIAEDDGADDEENAQYTVQEGVEDKKKRRKEKAARNAESNNFVIDPADLHDSDDFDALPADAGNNQVARKKAAAATKEAFQNFEAVPTKTELQKSLIFG